MIDWRFLEIFSPKNNFLEWKNDFEVLWWITLIFGLILIYWYYFKVPLKVKSNRIKWFYWGFIPSLIWAVLVFVYLQFIGPISGSLPQENILASITIFIWCFLIWYSILATLLRYILGWKIRIKTLGNGFLHKRRIPW